MARVARPGLSGFALVVMASGGVLIYAGLRNASVADTMRALIKGKLPPSRPSDLDQERIGIMRVLKQAQDLGAKLGGAAADMIGGIVSLPSPSGKYKLGPVKAWTAQVAEAIGQRFGLKTIYGWRASDPYPDHPGGVALDFMINDMPDGHAVGEAIANYAVANAVQLKIKYVIWNRRIWSLSRIAEGWRSYGGTNPHTDHVHVTVSP
jgi:hypothetical protein